MENLFIRDPQLKAFHEQIEARLYQYNRTKAAKTNDEQSPAAVVNLPVVVHIIHNNGAENISDARVQTAIQHLNEAFANTGYYDPSDGVNTQIQFCLAKRDPNGNATTGINRVVSPLTVMNGWEDYSVDLAVKNLSRWDPRCYINIWVVKDITGGVAGYAYFPSAHGSNVDGIMLEAAYFGSSNANDVVAIHEMGHYLGLYHTFEGGCSNNDCARDGDRVCDTPPDQSTISIGCNSSANSCTTDTQSGFSTDQNDLTKAYMDYGNWSCMKVFTQGQSDRMNWTVQNIRQSLLGCRSCMEPCTSPAFANFNSSANNISPGTLVNFTNTSTSATGYKWYLNNVLQGATTNFSYTFNTTGMFVVKLVALPGSALCDSSVKTDTIRVACPAKASFTPLSTSSYTNLAVNFINTSTGASSYNWFVNGVQQGTGTNFSYAFTSAGNYVIKLRATNGTCADSLAGTVVITDTCITQTFQKIYGGAGDDVAYDVRSTTDGGYIMAGKTNSFGSGNYDGYVIKTDALGNVQWSKVYGGAAEDYINKIMQTPDGGYVFVGTTRSYGSTATDAWVVKLDGSGTVQWAKRFGENTGSGEQALNICLTSDGGYAIIGSHNAAPAFSNVLVFKLDANGNLLWGKVFDSGNTDGGGSITQDGNVLMATGFTRTSISYHDALVMKIDIANGSLLWMYRYEIGGRNNFGGEIYKIGNQYKFHVPSIQDFTFLNTARNIILTIENNGTASAVQELIPPDNGSGPVVMAPDGGIVVAYNEQNVTSEFNIMKLGSNGGMQWAKKYTRPGPQLNYILRHSQDGGYITVGASNPAANNDIYFAKVDALGNSGGCDTASIAVSIATPSYSSGSFSWSANRNANFVNPQNINLQSSAPATPSTVLCFGTTCIQPPPPTGDTCDVTTFVKNYVSSRTTGTFTRFIKTPDNQVIAPGRISDVLPNEPTHLILAKLRKDGSVIWNKQYDGPVNNTVISTIVTSDNHYLMLCQGGVNTSSGFYLLKVDAAGNTVWKKDFFVATPEFAVIEIIESTDGNFYVVGGKIVSPALEIWVTKITVAGTAVWSKLYYRSVTSTRMIPYDIIDDGSALVLAGDYVIPPNQTRGFAVRINKSDGSVAWLKRYEVSTETISFQKIHRSGADMLLNVRGDAGSNHLFRMNSAGAINKARKFTSPGQSATGLTPVRQYISPEGQIINAGGFHDVQSSYKFALYKLDSSWNPVWTRKYNSITFFNTAGVFEASGNIFVGGTNQKPIIMKFTREGELIGCAADTFAITVSTPAINVIDMNFASVENVTFNNAVMTLTNVDGQFQVGTTTCEGAIVCNTLDLIGADTVCNSRDTVTYSVKRDATCTGRIKFAIDTAYAKIVSQTDSTIKIIFKRSGSVKLVASMTLPCDTLRDSIDIKIMQPKDLLNLGPDKLLCKISTLVLNAGSGFKTYRWQDGAPDSTYTVSIPGTYSVEATDSCGNILRDTVIISQAPDVPFDLGADLLKCDKDTLTITAPAGFVKYTWADNYNISNRYTQSVKVWPLADTTYTVIAETANGCLVYDSVSVTVKTAPPLNLGADTSICRNDSAIIIASGGFNSYLWNTGETSQQITVKNKGLYHVMAQAPNGCIKSDSLEILNVYPLPVVNLGMDTIICMNSNYTFNAGNFVSYLWQDGSVARTFTASAIGKYWVRVTDANKCINSDTAEILRIAALPQNFLDTAAELCSYEKITLTPKGSFAKYKWSTGSIARTIDVNIAAQYWLEVTNADGCVNREYINVKYKNCRNTIDFPNAFTPNHDRRHETYKPIVRGNITSYKFTIFNRWGQRVFETSQINYAWDGTIAGKAQGTGTFVWVCEYQFAGEKKKVAKGTVLLIR